MKLSELLQAILEELKSINAGIDVLIERGNNDG